MNENNNKLIEDILSSIITKALIRRELDKENNGYISDDDTSSSPKCLLVTSSGFNEIEKEKYIKKIINN